MNDVVDLSRASRDDLIELVVAQRARIADLERQVRWQAEELTAQWAAIAELTARVGSLLAADPVVTADDPATREGPRGMPGLKRLV